MKTLNSLLCPLYSFKYGLDYKTPSDSKQFNTPTTKRRMDLPSPDSMSES